MPRFSSDSKENYKFNLILWLFLLPSMWSLKKKHALMLKNRHLSRIIWDKKTNICITCLCSSPKACKKLSCRICSCLKFGEIVENLTAKWEDFEDKKWNNMNYYYYVYYFPCTSKWNCRKFIAWHTGNLSWIKQCGACMKGKMVFEREEWGQMCEVVLCNNDVAFTQCWFRERIV